MPKPRHSTLELLLAVGMTFVLSKSIGAPAAPSPAPDPSPPERPTTEPAAGRAATRGSVTDWVQAVAALVAVVVAGAAFFVALDTSHDQIASNSRTRQQIEQRYASRVSWWWDYGASAKGRFKPVVKVQNRSPVPLRGVVLITPPREIPAAGSSAGPIAPVSVPAQVFAFGDVPPCVLLTAELALKTTPSAPLTTAKVDIVRALVMSDGWRLDFGDPERNWSFGIRGLQAQPDDQSGLNDFAELTISAPTPGIGAVDDCGEGL